jgi:hypothetical protein
MGIKNNEEQNIEHLTHKENTHLFGLLGDKLSEYEVIIIKLEEAAIKGQNGNIKLHENALDVLDEIDSIRSKLKPYILDERYSFLQQRQLNLVERANQVPDSAEATNSYFA